MTQSSDQHILRECFQTDFCTPELIPVHIERSLDRSTGSRLNLVIPVVSDDRAYGGPATAIRLFDRMATEFDSVRLVLTHETESDFNFSKWTDWVVDRGGTSRRSIAFTANQMPLSISSQDFFIATFWSTALYTKRIVATQLRWHPGASGRYVYLIQDYEPAFYPWSLRYVYARSTYHDTEDVIAVFNSQQLADYFSCRRLHFPEQYVFAPALNSRLLKRRAETGARYKEKLILVYGRPGVHRNAFDLIVASLTVWANTFPSASDWTVISAGIHHADIPLGGQVILHSRGKLTLEEYADHLSRCWAGLSFVLSPHPGNPPLEMAEFGAWSITNTFECKDLTGAAPNIINLDTLTPEAVAERLIWCCEQYQSGLTTVVAGTTSTPERDQEEFPFVSTLVTKWKQPHQSPSTHSGDG